MNDLKAALDNALRHSAAQQRRYRLNDPHERLVLDAAATFRALLDDATLEPQLAALLKGIQDAAGPPPPPRTT